MGFKCEYLLVSLFICDGEQYIFLLWTKAYKANSGGDRFIKDN